VNRRDLGEPGDGDADDRPIAGRKREHLETVLGEDVGHIGVTTGLERLRVRARALPGQDLGAVDLAVDLFGRRLAVPLLISSMTGGVSEAGPVNRALAAAAQTHRIALGLGSGRILLEDPSAAPSFQVRDVAPDVLVLANLGAVQLGTYGPDDCAELVDRCSADALVLHLNAVQEAVQPGGDTQFAGLLERIAEVVEALDVPVVVKEVGFGLGPRDVEDVVGAGVAGVDVAAAGGTNWARVEGYRDGRAGAVAAAFADWGWPTARAVMEARRVIDRAEPHARPVLIASGGLRDGVDALKTLCLGADLAGVARGLLAAAAEGPAAATEAVAVLVEQLRIGAWAAGAARIRDLSPQLLDG
jgi:isopentenyl-diphosphate Delta-isomerase